MLRVLAFAAIGLATIGCASIENVERSMVFQPKTAAFASRPAGVEDAWFESADGVRLHGWFAEAERPRAVVLYAHGNGGNVSIRGHVLRLFREQLNTSVLVFDYRGYGQSGGVPSEAGVLADARAARQWLANKTGVRECDIVLVGHSLGGGVAVDLAAHDGARGLVLENTFTSLPDVAWSYVPLVPYRLLMRNRLDSLAKIGHYNGPLLQTHGDADEIVPYALGRRLFDAANEPKQFVHVSGGDHNDPSAVEYVQALDRFLDSLPPINSNTGSRNP